MINLESAVEGYAAKSLSKLVSKEIIDGLMAAQAMSLPTCSTAFGKLSEQVTDKSSLDHHIGLLNLAVELCLQHMLSQGSGSPCSCEGTAAQQDDGLLSLCGLFFRHHDANDILTYADSCKVGSETLVESIWNIFDAKKTSSPKLKNTLFGQTLCMHLIRAILDLYDKVSVSQKIKLNQLLVPLIRVMFDNPDRAHMVYTTYYGFWQGNKDEKGYSTSFHHLYGAELCTLEEFRSRGIRSRYDVLQKVSQISGETAGVDRDNTLPIALGEEINHIIHGEKEANGSVLSPFPKMTRMAQLTCFIRTIKDQQHGEFRQYSNHLGGIHYRRADIVHGEGSWTWDFYDAGKKAAFEDAVKEVYSAGHPLEFFKKLFGDKGEQTVSETWVQDGEVTFLWLCAVAAKLDQKLESWLTINQQYTDIAILLSDFINTTEKTITVTEISKFDTFIRKEICLVGDKESPTAKYYSLLNFISRVKVSSRPWFYASVGHKFQKVLASIPIDNDVQPKDFVSQLLNVICSNNITFEDLQTVRFPTFYLEVILRRCDVSPYTLFFHPITFDHDSGQSIPGVFLAGTFLGMETCSFPTCTVRQNYHKNSLIDAIRPIIDYEIGKVLQSDRQSYAETLVAAQRAEVLRRVQPAIEDLTKMFNEAQSKALQIRSAIDPDWSGLFSYELHRIVERIFNGRINEPYEISVISKDGSTGQIKGIFKPRHQTFSSGSEVCDMLLYLLRSLIGSKTINVVDLQSVTKIFAFGEYPEKLKWLGKVSTLVTNDRLTVFDNNWFLRECYEGICAARNDAERSRWSALLKVLAVDSMVEDRGVYLVQLAMVAKLAAKELNIYNPTPQPLAFFNSSDGMAHLQELLQYMDSGASSGGVLINTTGLKYRYRLQNNTSASVFLKALRCIMGDALDVSDESTMLRLVETSLIVTETHLVLLLKCFNPYTPALKSSVWNYMRENDGSYHDLRSNVDVISRAMGQPPDFLSIEQTAQEVIDAVGINRAVFAFINTRDNMCVIQIKLENL